MENSEYPVTSTQSDSPHQHVSSAHNSQLDQQQLLALMALQCLPGIGVVALSELLEKPAMIDGLLQGVAPSDWSRRSFNRFKSSLLAFARRPRDSAEWEAALRMFDWLEANGGGVIYKGSAEYPVALASIIDPPPLLYWQGNPEVLLAPSISIVGTRRPTPLGLSLASSMARDLSLAGFTVVSGLAMGIDASAHRATLDNGGKTVAVLPAGLDRPAPTINRSLAQAIAESEQGCLVSELPLSTPPSRGYYPRRNRIVSGLSAAVIVVEAEVKSGTLITAQLALEQNREVLAVPGSLANPAAKGCHKLLKEGATLVESAADVIDALAGFQTFPLEHQRPALSTGVSTELSKIQKDLLSQLDDAPEAFETIARRTRFSLALLTETLLDLELLGYVASDAGCYSRTQPS